jgi:hypothetical protein
MSFGQLKKLAYLIWLSFSSDFLQVDQLWDVRVHEYVVASSDTVKPKTPVPQITLGLHFTNSRATTRSFTIAP